MSGGWLGGLKAGVAGVADVTGAALRGTAEAGAALGAQLGGAAALIPAMPGLPTMSAMPVLPSLPTDRLAAQMNAAIARLREMPGEAGEAMALRFSGALARIQALPAEAAAAVGELTAVVDSLFPEHESASPAPEVPSLAAPESSSLPAVGRAGGIVVTARAVPRRTVVEPAAFGSFIRLQHPSKTAECCSALTTIPVDSVEKMLKRETLPNGRNFLLCIIAYGPNLIAAVLPEAEERWLIGAQILADQVRLEDELARAQAEMARNAGRWAFCGITFRGAA